MQRLIVTVMLAISAPVLAGEWTIVPRMSLQETYTDNLRLQETDKEDDLITQISPGIAVRGNSRRLKMNLNYNLQRLKYHQNDDLDSTNHQMQADINSELVEKIFFIDVNSRITQQQISGLGRVSNSNINDTGNRTTTMSYTVTPYVRHHLGKYADVELRLTRNEVFNNGEDTTGRFSSGIGNSQRTDKRFSLTSGRAFPRFTWALNYNLSNTDNDNSGSTEFKRIETVLGYKINRDFSAKAILGRDSNEYSASFRDTGGNSWELGGIWTPSPRTELEALYGRKYFGPTFSVKARHQHRRWNFTADYNERTQTTNQLLSTSQLISRFNEFGEEAELDPEALADLELATTNADILNEVNINKRLTIGATLKGRRSTLGFNFFRSENEAQVSGRGYRYSGTSVNFTRQLTPVVTANGSLSWSINTYNSGEFDTQEEDEDNIYSVNFSLSRALSTHLNASVNYRYYERASETRNEYQENRISAYLSYLF